MKKKEVALVYGITNNYVDKLANVLIGLTEKSKKFWDDIIVLHNGISDKNKKMINEIVNCNFIEIKRDDFMAMINEEAANLYSVAAFFRYECFNFLKNYRKIIWSDVDVLYQKDLSDILQYANTKDMAAVKALEEYSVINNFYDIVEDYDMFIPMYNSGLLVLNDELLKYGDLTEWCYSKTIQYAPLLRWPDQGIINIMIQEFNISVDNIDIDLYHCHPSFFEKGKEAKIVHAHGIRKFWNDEEYNDMYPLWNEYQKKWNTIKLKHNAMPLVSIVMTIYKRYDFLEECINSLLEQTYNNFEIILVIEKSDNQQEIKEFVEKYNDNRIKLICNKKREGFPKSLNIAIDNSKGKYIARMDDDDISLKIRLEEEVAFLENNLDIGMVSSNAEFFMNTSGKWFDKGLKDDEIKAELLVGCPICHPSVMFNKKIFEKYDLKYNPNYFSEDFELWSQASRYVKMERLNTVLVKYRASNLSLTGSNDNEDKIASSTKNTIKHQLKENLDLDLSDNEITSIQKRKNILNNYGSSQSIIDLKKNTIKKVIDANKQKKYYDELLLKKVLNYNEFFTDSIVKDIKKNNIIKSEIKSLLRPTFRLIKKVYNRISFENMFNIRLYFDELHNKTNYITEMTHRLDWDVNYSKNKINLIEENINRINNQLNNIKYENKMLKLLNYNKSANNIEFKLDKEALILNDTFDDFHHGSCATSFIIRERLKNKFKNVNSYGIEKLRFVKLNIEKIENFDDEKVLNDFIKNNRELIDNIKNVDVIVVNGEGCISQYNSFTIMLLYVIYISKKIYNKEIHLINTSVFLNNKVDLVTEESTELFRQYLNKSLSIIDSICVRDYISYETLKNNIQGNVTLAFDSVPLYIKNYYKHIQIFKQSYILLSGGNNINSFKFDDYLKIINKIIKLYNKSKIVFLISNVKTAKCTDDIKLYEKLKKYYKEKIILYEANSIDEFVSCIDDAKILISGRFHHTITALSCNTNFIVFDANTPKIKSTLEMFDMQQYLITETNIDEFINNLNNLNFDNCNYSLMKETMIELADKNY